MRAFLAATRTSDRSSSAVVAGRTPADRLAFARAAVARVVARTGAGKDAGEDTGRALHLCHTAARQPPHRLTTQLELFPHHHLLICGESIVNPTPAKLRSQASVDLVAWRARGRGRAVRR